MQPFSKINMRLCFQKKIYENCDIMKRDTMDGKVKSYIKYSIINYLINLFR